MNVIEKDCFYLTKELDRSPTKPNAAPVTATFRQPNRSVNMLTIGEQKKTIPIDSELTHAAEQKKTAHFRRLHDLSCQQLPVLTEHRIMLCV